MVEQSVKKGSKQAVCAVLSWKPHQFCSLTFYTQTHTHWGYLFLFFFLLLPKCGTKSKVSSKIHTQELYVENVLYWPHRHDVALTWTHTYVDYATLSSCPQFQHHNWGRTCFQTASLSAMSFPGHKWAIWASKIIKHHAKITDPSVMGKITHTTLSPS